MAPTKMGYTTDYQKIRDKKMKCPKCSCNRFTDDDEEYVCNRCGSAFMLEYLGYYEEGSDQRIDEGFEDEEQLELVKILKREENGHG